MAKGSKLSEVARLAGVSPITASRAIRGTGYVSEEARTRILAAAQQLNYTPDMLARRMRGERSKLIGVFVNNYGPVVTHEIIRAIGDSARAVGYDLLLFSAERFDSPARTGTCDMLTKLCDGVVLVMPTANDGFLATIERRQLACVLIGFDARQPALPVVVPDNRGGARTAVEHLLALGHRRIAFIAGNPHTGQSGQREQGYVDALRAAGVELDPALMMNGAFSQAGGFAATVRLLELAQPPTAIFAANDEMAFGAIDAIASRGLKVPQHVSVVGFDDIPTANYVFPRLTSIHQPFEAMGERAVAELVALIEGATPGPARIVFPTSLTRRDSTAAAGTGAVSPSPSTSR